MDNLGVRGMGNKVKSFESFLFLGDRQIHLINDIEEYANNHNGEISYYDGRIFCPECNKAELSFVHKTNLKRAHLRRKARSSHDEDCSYNYEYANRKTVKEYLDSLSKDQIEDKLQSMMNMLFKSKNNNKESNREKILCNNMKNPFVIINTNGKNKLNTIRRKSLNTWIDSSDSTQLSVFYGRVKLKSEERTKKNKDEKYNLLKIYTYSRKNGEWVYRTSIYRGNIKDTVSYDKEYYISMIGNLDFSYKYWSIKLYKNNALIFKEIEKV